MHPDELPFLGAALLIPTAKISITTAITRMNTEAQNIMNFGPMVRSFFLAMFCIITYSAFLRNAENANYFQLFR